MNSLKLQERLGNTSNFSRWLSHTNFHPKKQLPKLRNRRASYRTGAITPVAKVEPVTVGESLSFNATLHNEDEINRKDIRVGDTIQIQRAGDVIPQVISVDSSKRNQKVKNIFFQKNVYVEL